MFYSVQNIWFLYRCTVVQNAPRLPPCPVARPGSFCIGICLETVGDQGLLLKRLSSGLLATSCAHAYCFTCVVTWSERTNTCPMCKERFNAVRRKPGLRIRGVGETVEVKKIPRYFWKLFSSVWIEFWNVASCVQ